MSESCLTKLPAAAIFPVDLYLLLQNPELFELLARATMNRMHELSPHSLSDLTWAFAAARQPNAVAVLTAAAPAAAACLERFSAGMLADMLWSYASVGVRHEALLAAAAKVGRGGYAAGNGKCKCKGEAPQLLLKLFSIAAVTWVCRVAVAWLSTRSCVVP
jgi:hypothetical protein